jgi:hypothetical protein
MKCIGIEPAAEIRFPGDAVEAGTFQGWQKAVAAAAGVANCPHWVLGAAAGFVGPVIGLCEFDTCGINFSGPTSRGKTTAVALGVSAWTSPSLTSGGLLRSMLATETSIEISARQSNHLILGLDELAHIDGKTVGKTIYLLSGGVSKGRGTTQITQREQLRWRTFVLLSSEKSLAQKVNGEGGQWTGGMAVRFPDIDCSEIDAKVPKATLDAIAGIYRNHGWGGGAFVCGLQHDGIDRDPDTLRSRVLAAAETIAGNDSDGARRRAALPFALILVCGWLAQQFGLLPETTDLKKAVEWGWEQFTLSTEALALNPQGLAMFHLRRWIAEHWDVAIKKTDLPYKSMREAVGWYDDNAIYIPVARISEAIGGAMSISAFARRLTRRDLLWDRTDATHATIRRVPGMGPVDVYALRREAFRDV